jgi:hypothetical protein
MIRKLWLTNRLIYSRTLQCQNFCSHTPDTHNFEGYGVVASIKVETSDVLDIRLPQMQVGPNVVKRKSGRDAAEDALEHLVSEDKRTEAQDRLAQEIIDYVKSVDVVMNRIVSLPMDSLDLANESARSGRYIGRSDVSSGQYTQARIRSR